jgi:diacylglycerol kinase family enzyme
MRTQEYNLDIDGEEITGQFMNISVSNTACIGDTMMSSPYADPTDGLLDGLLLKSGKILETIGRVIDYTSGHFEKNKAIKFRQFKKMEIKSNLPICVHLDSEPFFAKEYKIEIAPSRIKVFAPEGLKFEDFSYKAYSQRSMTVKAAV